MYTSLRNAALLLQKSIGLSGVFMERLDRFEAKLDRLLDLMSERDIEPRARRHTPNPESAATPPQNADLLTSPSKLIPRELPDLCTKLNSFELPEVALQNNLVPPIDLRNLTDEVALNLFNAAPKRSQFVAGLLSLLFSQVELKNSNWDGEGGKFELDLDRKRALARAVQKHFPDVNLKSIKIDTNQVCRNRRNVVVRCLRRKGFNESHSKVVCQACHVYERPAVSVTVINNPEA
jgi:hypothetical protein